MKDIPNNAKLIYRIYETDNQWHGDSEISSRREFESVLIFMLNRMRTLEGKYHTAKFCLLYLWKYIILCTLFGHSHSPVDELVAEIKASSISHGHIEESVKCKTCQHIKKIK